MSEGRRQRILLVDDDGDEDDLVSLVATANLLAHPAGAAPRARTAFSRSIG